MAGLFSDQTPIDPIKDKYNQADAEESFNLYKETKDPKYAIEFAERIRSKFVNTVNIKLDDASFLEYRLPNGKTILDAMLKENVKFSFQALTYIANKKDIIKLLVEKNMTVIAGYIGEETLFEKLDETKTVFDLLLEHNCVGPNVLRNITTVHKDIVPKVGNYNEKLLAGFDEFILFETEYKGKRLIEYLLINQLMDFKEMRKILFHPEIVDLCFQYNQPDLLKFLGEMLLSTKRGDSTVLAYLLDKGIKPLGEFTNIKNLKVLLDHNEAEYLVKLSESILLQKFEDGKTILESMLEKGMTPKIVRYTQKESIEVLSKLKRYDLMCTSDINVLLLPKTLNETYLEQILKNINYAKDNSLMNLNRLGLSNMSKARLFITVAKYDLMNYIPAVKTTELLKKEDNSCLLDILLDMDIDLTINRIIPPEIIDNIDIAIRLRLRGINQEKLSVDLDSENFINYYYDDYNRRFEHLPIDEEGKLLLNELYEVMSHGGKSDKETLDTMMKSYEFMLYTNSVDAKAEIRKIIEIKKAKPSFGVVKEEKEGSFFDARDNRVHMKEHSLGCLNHEMAHAFFQNLTDGKCPAEFTRIVYKIKEDKDFINKVQEYCRKFQEIEASIMDMVEEKYMKKYDRIMESRKEQIQEFLSKTKEEKKEDLLNNGYQEETVDIILNKTYNIEEYMAQNRRVKKECIADAILKTEYGAFISIGDMLDAILGGSLASRVLRNDEGHIIPAGYGHGMPYYRSEEELAFNETLANFSTIIKSIDYRESLGYLRQIVGEEYINLLFNYYKNEILLSTKNQGLNI